MTEDGTTPDSSAKTENATEQEEKSGEEYWKTYCDEQRRPSTDFAALIDTISQEAKTSCDEKRREDRGHKFRECLTIFLVFVTAAAIIYQAYIFSGQLDEMKTSGEQTAKLIDTNAKLAEATAKQAEAADKQAGAMAAAVEVSKESLIVAGRAWVGPRQAKITSPIEAGKPIELIFEYANSGREPALDFSYSVDGFISSNEEEQRGTSFARVLVALHNCSGAVNAPPGQVVFPSTGFSSFNLSWKYQQLTLDQEVISGEKTLIVQGCFLYKSFKIVRHSYFCYFYRGNSTKPDNFNICTAGHYAD